MWPRKCKMEQEWPKGNGIMSRRIRGQGSGSVVRGKAKSRRKVWAKIRSIRVGHRRLTRQRELQRRGDCRPGCSVGFGGGGGSWREPWRCVHHGPKLEFSRGRTMIPFFARIFRHSCLGGQLGQGLPNSGFVSGHMTGRQYR